jgi:hypothetical protein
VLFEHFFPGVVPATPGIGAPEAAGFSPGDPLYTEVLKALQDGFVSPGQPTLQFARTANLQAATNAEIVTAGMTVVGFAVRQFNDLLDVTYGHMPYDNSEPMRVYAGSDNDGALNENVARFVGDPAAMEYMEHYYTPTGDLHVSVITLHKVRDPLVPRSIHEDKYAVAVQNAGASQYLLQHTVGGAGSTGFGHCGFPNDELAAFAALVQWVRTGARPQY